MTTPAAATLRTPVFRPASKGGTTAAVTSLVRQGATLTAMAAGDLVINGVTIGASKSVDDTASSTGNAASGLAIAAAINRATSQTGVKAAVNATQVVGGTAQTGTADSGGTVTINGVATTVVHRKRNRPRRQPHGMINAINTISGQTGVVATRQRQDNHADGCGRSQRRRRGRCGSTDAQFGASVGLDDDDCRYRHEVTAQMTASTIKLSSAGSFTVASGSGGNAGVSNAGFELGTFGGATKGPVPVRRRHLDGEAARKRRCRPPTTPSTR